MDLESTCGMIRVNMKEDGRRIRFVERVCINGLMVENTMVIG